MKKNFKIILLILVVVVTIVGVVCLSNKKVDSSNVENEIYENTIPSNEIINKIENVVAKDNNKVDTLDEEKHITPSSASVQSQIYESESNVGTTDKKEEAIKLVKDFWGEDDTVTYRCDSITSAGEYIIAVTSLETASVRSYFRVNLESRTVEIDY